MRSAIGIFETKLRLSVEMRSRVSVVSVAMRSVMAASISKSWAPGNPDDRANRPFAGVFGFPLDMSLNLEFVLDMFPPNPTASAYKVTPFPGFQPGGMAEKAVHELRAPEATVAHAAFAVLLLTKLAQARPILWVGPSPSWYPPGLAWLGLDPARCLFAKTRNDAESLGMLEVALRGGMAGVAECAVVSRLAARRLALAAQSGGSTG